MGTETFQAIQTIKGNSKSFELYMREFERVKAHAKTVIPGAVIQESTTPNIRSIIKGMDIFKIAFDTYVSYSDEFKSLYYLKKVGKMYI